MSKIIDVMSEKLYIGRIALVAHGETGMSYEEKGAWVYLVVVLGTYGAYLAVILGRANGTPLAEVAYVAPMLWLIGISIALNIIGRVVLAAAMSVPFALALAKASQFWIANAMYAAFVAFALASTLVRIVAYRR